MKVTLITVGVATSLGSECEVLVSGKKTKAKQSQVVCLLDIMQLTANWTWNIINISVSINVLVWKD